MLQLRKCDLRKSDSSIRVPFGLREGRLFEPTQVERGLACGCRCPGCGGELVAKHAPAGKVQPHFSHLADADCVGGLESALHLAAKQLIQDRQQLFLPEIVATVRCREAGFTNLERHKHIRDGVLVNLFQVNLEKSVGSIRPDLTVRTEDQQIFVEIAYTSFVTEEKREKICQLKTAAIEVDVSSLTIFNFGSLAKLLFEPTPYASWIFHPDLHVEESLLQKLVDADFLEEKSRRQQQEIKRLALADSAAAQTRKKFTDEAFQRLYERSSEVMAAKNKAKPFKVLPDAQKLSKAVEKLGVVQAELDCLLPINVRCYSAIASRPVVWQTSVLADLVHPALRRGKPVLTAEQVRMWLQDRFDVDTASNRAAIAVGDYLDGLAELQILHRQRRQEFLVMVPDIAGALEVARNIRQPHEHELCWCAKWPTQKKAAAVAQVFSDAYGQPSSWHRVSGLLQVVCEKETPVETMRYYCQLNNKSALDFWELRQFFLSAGFAYLRMRGSVLS